MASWWKNYGKSALIGAAAGLGSSYVPGLKNFTPVIAAGAGALANKDNRLGGALAGFTGGGLAAAGKGAITGGGWQGAKTGTMDYFGQLPGMKGLGTATPTGALAKFMAPKASQADVLKNGTSLYQPRADGMGYSPVAAGVPSPTKLMTPTTTSVASSFAPAQNQGGMLQKILPQAGTMLAGKMFSTPVATPDYTPAKEMLAQISANGADPEARNLAMQEYNRLLKAPINSVPQDVIDAEERLAQQKDAEDLRQLDIAWKGIRPGVDVSGDSEYVKQRAELVDRQNRAAQDRNAQRNYQYTEANQNRRLSAANTLAQLDQSQKQQIMQMAQLTVDEINAQFGLDLQSEAEKAALFEGLGQVFAGGAGTANNPGGAVQIYMGGAQ